MLRTFITITIAWFLLPGFPAFAQLTSAEIVERIDEARNPQIDYTVTVEITTYSNNQLSKSATYEVLVKGKEKTVVKTILPAVEKGRVLLMLNENLWAFLPEVSKPLRISLQERLIGEVANGDVARVNFAGDYTPIVLRTETLNDKDCYVLELTAKDDSVTYGKVIVWAEKETLWPRKAEFYALSGRMLKTCAYQEYQLLGDRIRPTQLVMEGPLAKGKKSIIRYSDIHIEELPEKYFTKEYMKKFME
ncbi:MAG: hypothetical protein A2Y00_03735 [Omnitrophica WOR_2 bacterium GWF2_43_52]|nr:MAG: hypothetical protein A2062_00940 [Omnitrophica WOR_2 bacterium GWA2_44_7]OGX14861.1 MAG: hypothetical protein A2Y01_03265 [Omnitrophica WOR_2 bacterium GWC2_44_8]OGX22544.1 MAG: hypothetical protein A2Y00_03735 [Omnitrophica WOR_2 bacterium GWF2_43_52]HAH21451.1 protein LolF [Candidatus Omnitrophota bacterium]HBG64633.1 protein LolF [Candidatus Omnitrophota bacterium]